MASTKKPKRSNTSELLLLKKIGLRIHQDLFEMEKPVEWLSFKVGVARSSIREIIAGRSNPRVMTLKAISAGLGYKSVVEFLSKAGV